jgi:hypothetical protein
MISIRLLSGSILAALIAFGCSTSSTPTADSCGADSTVSCPGGGSGYSCSGSAVPDSSLNCSGATADANGNADYCCGSVATGSCDPDTSVSCQSGSDGYTCTDGATPTAAMNCSQPTSDSGGDHYCCGTASTTCVADSSVEGCTGSSTGYSCTGTDTPDQSASLSCSDGVAGNGETLYCCTDFMTPASCMVDDTVTGCTGGSYGFSCTGTDAPDANDASLSCSDGVASGADTDYCCIDITTPATCSPDDSVTGCTGDSYGYSCTGSDPPDATDTSIVCSEGVMSGGDTIYCCIDNTSTSCTQDDSVQCSTAGSYGFTCTGTDAPSDSDTSLTCSAPTADGGNSTYCCE